MLDLKEKYPLPRIHNIICMMNKSDEWIKNIPFPGFEPGTFRARLSKDHSQHYAFVTFAKLSTTERSAS